MPSYSMTDCADRIELCVEIVSNWNISVLPTNDTRIRLSADQNRPEGALPGPPRRAMPRTIFWLVMFAEPDPAPV